MTEASACDPPLDHVPVMPEEVVSFLRPRPGGTYVDCTLGAGGHSLRIAQAMGHGRIVGFDKDPVALKLAASRWSAPGVALEMIQADFAEARAELQQRGWEQVDGTVADLGMSSMQVNRPERGFSFAADGPLDMRMDPRQPLTAEQVVNQYGERELADLIFQFGEERRSRRIARAIVRSRPLHSTAQLAEVVAAVNRPMNPASKHRGRGLHPATRTFQALRIFVNSEIDSLTHWLDTLPLWLGPGARAVVISFHSLEDRPVKQAFREGARQGWCRNLTPHPVRPGAEETARNARARSARLRAIEKLQIEADGETAKRDPQAHEGAGTSAIGSQTGRR